MTIFLNFLALILATVLLADLASTILRKPFLTLQTQNWLILTSIISFTILVIVSITPIQAVLNGLTAITWGYSLYNNQYKETLCLEK